MTATDELRRMLDERGVEHLDGYADTAWDVDGIRYLANDHLRLEGRMVLRRTCTPEQAIEATLGRGTCSCTTPDGTWCFVCSECGKSFPRSDLHFAHNHGEINFCPNCGRRVVS